MAGVTQAIGIGVIAGLLLSLALLGAMAVAGVLIVMVGQTAFEGGMVVLFTFGLTTRLAAKLFRLF
jgi:hypothetical protein